MDTEKNEEIISENEEMKKETNESTAEEVPVEFVNDFPEKVEENDKELNQLKSDLETYKDKYIRLIAEFENYKKRTLKEKIEYAKLAGSEVHISLLPVLDDFERAIKSINEATDIEALKAGVNLIFNKLKSTLESQGLKQINSIGEKFDSDIHEAITEIDAPKEELKGKVVDELEKGYKLNDKIIRYAKVVIGK